MLLFPYKGSPACLKSRSEISWVEWNSHQKKKRKTSTNKIPRHVFGSSKFESMVSTLSLEGSYCTPLSLYDNWVWTVDVYIEKNTDNVGGWARYSVLFCLFFAYFFLFGLINVDEEDSMEPLRLAATFLCFLGVCKKSLKRTIGVFRAKEHEINSWTEVLTGAEFSTLALIPPLTPHPTALGLGQIKNSGMTFARHLVRTGSIWWAGYSNRSYLASVQCICFEK